MKMKRNIALALTMLMTVSAVGCSSSSTESTSTSTETTETETTTVSYTSVLDTSDLFSSRDMKQTAHDDSKTSYTIVSGEDITITEEGVYIISGEGEEVTIIVDVDDSSKVQIVLDGVTITNLNDPVIYVKNADKVFVTTVGDSTLSTTGAFISDEENSLDAVIYSCDDLVLNGTATLTINSTAKAVKSKDDLKITGGTYNIECSTVAFYAHDSIRVADGTFNVNAGTDAFHAENNDDDTLGYIYIADGTFNLNCGDDAIHGTTVVQVDGGTFNISASEGIEGTYVQVNGGTWNIYATGDGINAGQKSNAYNVTLEINGGDFTIEVAEGDTDALDSNGDMIIRGGTITITAPISAIDFDGTGTFTGGTLTVNGVEVTNLDEVNTATEQ